MECSGETHHLRKSKGNEREMTPLNNIISIVVVILMSEVDNSKVEVKKSNEPTQAKRNEFEELYASANEELYPGCDYVTRLDFMAKFTYFKVKGKLTDSIFNEMLEFFQHVFPTTKGYKLPPSYYAIKKTFKTIGLGYESIHACVNDCFLFRGDNNKDVHFCPVCKTSRWKDSNTPGKKVPKKVLRYFPIIPRLQRLYKSSHTAKEMTWHATGKCTEPGKMQHPVDGRAWKNFDTKYPNFAKEPRNVRLGLAADGFNPFGNLSQAYSMWPVILTTYNLPPWLCMKESSFMLTLLIPGPKSPGKDIDVYLRPLIDDLKVLWALKGVETIDVATGQKFNMRAMVLWTINDFPARSSLSGWSGQGYLACPTCNKDTPSVRVLGKTAYVGHRRFLKKPHKWRRSLEFNGEIEDGDPPTKFNRNQIQAQLARLPTRVKGKHPSYGGVKIKRNVLVELNWTKRSIFYELEYWSFLTLKHNLDIMHIEKNVLEAILNTLLMNDKSKDTAKARQDLKRLGIRSGLWLGQTKNGKCSKPQAAYSFTPENRKKFFWREAAESKPSRRAAESSREAAESTSSRVNKDDPDIIHFDNSSDLPLSTSLNDLDNATLHIDGQSTVVDAPPDIIDVPDEDDDIIDDEDALPHDLADSDVEDLINVDDDGVEKMSAHVARSHGGDGSGDDRPPSHVVPTGCGGCFSNRGKGKRKPNLGGKTRNLSLKEIAETKGPVPITFEVGDKQTLNPLGPHAAHWSNYIGEVVRSVPLYYPSWEKVPKERKAAIISNIGTLFDLRPHMESSRWTEIYEGINMHLQKAYNTNKASFKAKHWKADPTTGSYDVEAIRRARPEEITAAEWDKYIKFWNDPKNLARAAQNRLNRQKSVVTSRQGSRSLARLRDEMRQASDTQEYPSLIDTFWRTHTVDGVFPKDEDRRIYEEMKRLEATGEYTEDEINALARGGKLRGHIPGVGRVLPSRATSRPSMPAPDKSLKSMHRKVDFMMSLFRSDSKYSDMFKEFESGGASGSGGCGDDEESGDDEDGDGDD
ncbi:zinc finger, PHD-type containing protein [Tanacetum coccineum]